MSNPPTRRINLKNLRRGLAETELSENHQHETACRQFRKTILSSAHLSSVADKLRPYNIVRLFNRSARASVRASAAKRQDQFPEVVFGRFMRASVPRPNKYCSGTIAVFATEAITARIKSQLISAPPVSRYCKQNARSFSICV